MKLSGLAFPALFHVLVPDQFFDFDWVSVCISSPNHSIIIANWHLVCPHLERYRGEPMGRLRHQISSLQGIKDAHKLSLEKAPYPSS